MTEIWDQRLDEPSELYRQFVWWRNQVPRPMPSDPAVAQTFDWSTRAAAWDQARTLPEDRNARIAGALDDMITVTSIVLRKLKVRELTSDDPTVSAKDASVMLKNLATIAATIRGVLPSEDVKDVVRELEEKDLTADECRAILKFFPQ